VTGSVANGRSNPKPLHSGQPRFKDANVSGSAFVVICFTAAGLKHAHAVEFAVIQKHLAKAEIKIRARSNEVRHAGKQFRRLATPRFAARSGHRDSDERPSFASGT